MSKAQIAKLLRGADSVEEKGKDTFQVTLPDYGTATLTLTKAGINIGGERTVPYALAVEYLGYLLNPSPPSGKWSKAKHKTHLHILALLYGHRASEPGKKLFVIDDDGPKPSRVKLSPTGAVSIAWSDGLNNVYNYPDCVKDLTVYGQAPIANIEYTALATMEEIERNPHLMKKLLGPAHPQPPTISNDAMKAAQQAALVSTEKQRWHDPERNLVFITEPGTNVTPIAEVCIEIDKPRMKELRKRQNAKKVDEWKPATTRKRRSKRKPADPNAPKQPRAPRGKGLGVGGKPLDAKQLKAAQKAIAGINAQGKKIRLLITEYDADNETISDLVECEDVAVQRTRRAILREAKNA